MKKRKHTPTNTLLFSPFFLIIASILGVLMVAKVVVTLAENRVLGSQTLIAHGGNDDDDEDKSDSSGSSGSSDSGSGSGSGSSDTSGSNNDSSSTDGSNNLPSDIKVINVGNSENRGGEEDDNETEDSSVRFRTQTKDDETKTDIRLSENERIRTRTKDGRTRIDITSGGIKTRLEYRDDRVIIKAEQEDGTEVELEDDTLLKIDERLAEDGIKVATAGGDRFFLQRGNAGAVTDFPLSIDLATNTLYVTTPAGVKAVAVLPDAAIQNMIASNVVNRLGGGAVEQIITLGEANDIPIYEINGISDQKLLGFIPVQIEKEVVVSAETGEIVSATVPSAVDRVLDLLSF